MTAELVFWIAGGVFVVAAVGVLVFIALVVGSKVEHALRDWWR